MRKSCIGPSKQGEAERRVNQAIRDYFDTAIDAGKSQQTMSENLGVTKATVNKWLRTLGYSVEISYRKPRRKSVS